MRSLSGMTSSIQSVHDDTVSAINEQVTQSIPVFFNVIFRLLTSGTKAMVMGVPGPQHLAMISIKVTPVLPVKHCTEIHHPKSGDCIFPKQKGMTRNTPTVGLQT